MATFEFLNHYTSEDHSEVLVLTRKKSLKKQRGRLFWWGILIVFLFSMMWVSRADSALVWLLAGVVIGWLSYLSTAWKQQKRYWTKIWEDNPSFRDELRTKLDSDGVRRYSNSTEFFGTWKAFTSLEETTNLFILFTGSSWFLTIPKRVCETPERLIELRTFLFAQIPSKME
jgi:hypothetical protein